MAIRDRIIKLGTLGALIFMGLVAVELFFRVGGWEPFVRPESNAGQSVRLKAALLAEGVNNLEFVTLGDSRTVYGLDHKRIADAARAAGRKHHNLSLAGSHWLTINAVTDWVHVRGGSLRGAVIAMSTASFIYAGNGNYELGMAVPFMRNGALDWEHDRLEKSVPFKKDEVATWGVHSATFQYREDIQNLVREPLRRLKEMRSYAGQGAAPLTFTVKHEPDSCGVPISSIAECADFKPMTPSQQVVVNHCKAELPHSRKQLDWRDWSKPGAVPHLEELARLRQDDLRALKVRKPIVFILMPEIRARRNELNPKGLDLYVQHLLKPLVDDGTIVLHDFSRFFDDTAGGECTSFWDLLHQSAEGQKRLTDAVLPIIQKEMYARRKQPSNSEFSN
jgi:hypothetical protein